MVIETSNFISDVIIFIRNLLRDNISDPLSRRKGFIMTAYPKREIQYPVCVIRNTGITTEKIGMSSEIHFTTMTLEIKIFSLNSKEIDTLTQNVINILRTNQYGTDSTDVEDIHGFLITSVVPIVDLQGDSTIHQRVISIDYKVVLGE